MMFFFTLNTVWLNILTSGAIKESWGLCYLKIIGWFEFFSENSLKYLATKVTIWL